MTEYRERSRSPHHPFPGSSRSHDQNGPDSRSRSRSPKQSRHKREHHRSHKHDNTIPTKPLPLDAQALSKRDLSTHRPLFALYLDVQKQLDIDDIPENEVKGRWKSFVKKWNAGDLAEGWYDEKTFEKAKRGVFGLQDAYKDNSYKDGTRDTHRSTYHGDWKQTQDADEDDDRDFGPSLPQDISDSLRDDSSNVTAGPSVPSTHDLRARNEQIREDTDAARNSYIENVRAERRADRRLQKERLDEVAPRAEPGSRERQLEKKRDMALSNRAFAAGKEAGGEVELRDADVMGDEDSLGELRRMKEMEQRKKTEREVRREEVLRARTAEREEKMKGLREKEAKTMDMLKSIARARFGGNE